MKNQCDLMSNKGIYIQVALGIICATTLFIKWQMEKPRWKTQIFLLDTFKQVISQVVSHFINVYVSKYL